MKVRVDSEQGVPRVQVGQKLWVLAETLRESGPLLPDAMGRQVAAWDRRRGAGSRAGGSGWHAAPGRSGQGPRRPSPCLHYSIGLSPPGPGLPQAGGPPKEAKSESPSVLPAVILVITPGLRDSPAPRRLVTLRPTLCSLEAAAHFRPPVALGPSPSTQSARPRKPSGVPHPSAPTPTPVEIFRLSQGSELSTGPRSTLSGGGFPLQKKGLGLGPAQEPATLSHKPSKARGPQRPFLPH